MAKKLTSKPVSADKPYTHPADLPVIDGKMLNLADAKTVINGVGTMAGVIALPFNDQKLRSLTNHRGEAYRFVDIPDQVEMLKNQIKLLEVEHFGLVRGMSTIPHAVVHEDGETSNEALRRFYSDRIPHVEAELDRLYDELDALQAQDK